MGESIAEVAAIAAKLTKAQRTFLLEERHLFARGYKPGEKLIELGFLDRHRGNFGDRITLTERGTEARNHLISQGADHDR